MLINCTNVYKSSLLGRIQTIDSSSMKKIREVIYIGFQNTKKSFQPPCTPFHHTSSSWKFMKKKDLKLSKYCVHKASMK